MARRMAAVAELLGQRTSEVHTEDPDPGYMIITGFQRTAAEVAAAMNLAPSAASTVVSHADTLAQRLPMVAAVLAAGDTDWRTVQVIITRTEFVKDSVIRGLGLASFRPDRERGSCWSRKRTIDTVDAAVREVDPDAIRERVRREDRRHISVTAVGDGTARVDGVRGRRGRNRRRQAADRTGQRCLPRRSSDRGPAPRRRDAGDGPKAASWPANVTPRTARTDPMTPPRPTRIVVNIIAGAETVLGGGSEPGYIEGYGVVDAEQVRRLAEDATLRLVEQPVVSAADELRYQPSAAVERAVRLRDLTCRFPGCDRPAVVCDLDHTVPFNHADPRNGGLTVPGNLKCMCRQHHRLKTFHDGWRDEQLPTER